MGRPRTVSDDAILEAARAVFLEHGPGASTSSIALEAGLSQAALFKRFGTKQELMVAALAPPEVPPFTLLLADGPSPDRPVEAQLAEIGRAMAAFLADVVPCAMVLKASGTDFEELLGRFEVPPPVRARQALSGWLARAMHAGLVRRCDAVAVASALMGALHLHVFTSHLAGVTPGPQELSDYVDRVVEALWSGLAPERGAP